VNIVDNNSIHIKNISGDVIGAGISGTGNIVGKQIHYTVKGNVININNPSEESLEELRKILAFRTEIPPNKDSIITETTTQQQLSNLDKHISNILNLVKTAEDKVGTLTTEIKAGKLNVSRVDLLLRRAIVLTESSERYWNVSSKHSKINNYTRKNKEAYLLLQEANHLEPYNTQILLVMAKVQGKLMPNNPIKMQKILYDLKKILDMTETDVEKFQLAQATFLLAIFSEPIDDQLIEDARVMFEKLGRRDWVRQCDDLRYPRYGENLNSKGWTNKGWTLGTLGKYQQAIDCFDKAIEITPNEVKALRGKASVLGRLEKYQQAIDCFDKAIKITPNDYGLHKSKGTAYYYLEKYEQAIDCYDRAIEIDSTDEGAWKSKGSCLYAIEKYEQAIDCYDKAIQIMPNDADTWNKKAEPLNRLQKYDDALMCCNKSISIDPDNAYVWYNKALCLSGMHHYKNAEDCLNKAKELDPTQ
jgi:tetratricopeptide (TPR) repeat protein